MSMVIMKALLFEVDIAIDIVSAFFDAIVNVKVKFQILSK